MAIPGMLIVIRVTRRKSVEGALIATNLANNYRVPTETAATQVGS